MIHHAELQHWTRWNIAVTGMNAKPDNPGPGVAVARCLREEGSFRGRIVGLGYETLDPGLHQRETCDSGHLLPYPAAGAAALLERLDEVLEVEPVDALIPCLDAELPNFIAIEAELRRRGVRMMIPGREQLRRRDKDRLPELCAAAGVATPDVRRLPGADFFDTCAVEGWAYPLVVKSVFYDAYVVNSPAEAKLRFQQMAASWGYPVLVQRYVEGDEVNLTALGDGRGAMVGEVMMKKQALTDKGKAWAGVAIDDPDLREVGRKVLSELRWCGPLELEMLRDESGTLHLIEINPRFPAWIYLSHGVGRNLPAALLALLHGTKPERLPLAPPRPGTTFIRHARETIVPIVDIANLTLTGSTLPAIGMLAHAA
ncbi:ATP-grasp domain-containing protein [Accumulibacter sp.]|uniref:ATP-grasp domain-containing protein n=1 Tax=Accumulibacter sp. TaxID=2053492 RepID=UPI0025D1870D|nr:ATP-grasp domain-containing protein [Accumulibacter sp.]MCM8594098.1 ATP-grasp domain-containing protein [Accumulibacter sp.]MCM8624507.1 ATP-grasp domain-containing protein [Accumulibacter sp.]MDS4048241.1 ATP-grasp domain-containing protein [Accumulibacter sp.]